MQIATWTEKVLTAEALVALCLTVTVRSTATNIGTWYKCWRWWWSRCAKTVSHDGISFVHNILATGVCKEALAQGWKGIAGITTDKPVAANWIRKTGVVDPFVFDEAETENGLYSFLCGGLKWVNNGK
jgi:hypothetical protein